MSDGQLSAPIKRDFICLRDFVAGRRRLLRAALPVMATHLRPTRRLIFPLCTSNVFRQSPVNWFVRPFLGWWVGFCPVAFQLADPVILPL